MHHTKTAQHFSSVSWYQLREVEVRAARGKGFTDGTITAHTSSDCNDNMMIMFSDSDSNTDDSTSQQDCNNVSICNNDRNSSNVVKSAKMSLVSFR